MADPELSADSEEVLLSLAMEEAKGSPPSPVPVRVLAELLGLSERECSRVVHELARQGLASQHDAGPGRSILNAASLSDRGRDVAFERALVEAKGPVSKFSRDLTPLQLTVLNVLVERESRVAGALLTRTHLRTAVRKATASPPSIEEVNHAIDGLGSSFLALIGGQEPCYRATLRGLLASKWGINVLEAIDSLLVLLRDLLRSDPALTRYSWSAVRRGLSLPRKAEALFNLTVTQAGLGNGIFKSEGDDWWSTPTELDVILENASGLDLVGRLLNTPGAKEGGAVGNDSGSRFSERQGYQASEPAISVREEAPDDLRGLLVDYAYEAGMRPGQMRSIVCGLLLKRPNPSNWSEFPNVDSEARDHVDSCAWYHVYDLAEAVYEALVNKDPFGRDTSEKAELFGGRLNRLFRAKGIGWQLVEGRIQVRGEEAFEVSVRDVHADLAQTGRNTAATEIHQALLDLSARPTADTTGAIQHAIAALECVLRDVSNDPKSTLGALISRYRDRFPAPLDQALEKLWGFASENGRHLREGRVPSHEDAILVVHIAAATTRYLLAQTASAS